MDIKEFFEGFRNCASKSKEFYLNFDKLGLKEVKKEERTPSKMYFRNSRRFYYNNVEPVAKYTYYEADEYSLLKWNKMLNCRGNNRVPSFSSFDSVHVIELKMKK